MRKYRTPYGKPPRADKILGYCFLAMVIFGLIYTFGKDALIFIGIGLVAVYAIIDWNER